MAQQGGSSRRPIVSGAVALGLLALAVGACRDRDAPLRRSQTSANVSPLEGAAPLPGGASYGPAATPVVEATVDVSAGAPQPGASPERTMPVGVIPVATTRPTASVGAEGPPRLDPELAELVAAVDPARLTASVRSLVGFGTRHPLSAADDPDRGVGAASRWLGEQFLALDGTNGNQVLVEFEEVPVTIAGKATTQRNVLATLPGIDRDKRIVYVTAHYDSRTEDVADGRRDAPGADDDASGAAALLELARLLSRRRWDATIRLAAFAAEEQDAAGSRYHAAAARQVGLPIAAAINLDIVGSTRGPAGPAGASEVRVFSADPEDSPSRRLARHLAARSPEAGLSVRVVPEADRQGRRGDHLSFSEAGFPAVRLVESPEDPSRQHNQRDTMDRLEPDYLAAVTRLALGHVAGLALAPAAPPYAPVLEPAIDAPGRVRARWDPIVDPSVAGYWVAVRDSGEPAYSDVRWVGRATDTLLGERAAGTQVAVSVAAADDLGHTSLFGPESTWRYQ